MFTEVSMENLTNADRVIAIGENLAYLERLQEQLRPYLETSLEITERWVNTDAHPNTVFLLDSRAWNQRDNLSTGSMAYPTTLISHILEFPDTVCRWNGNWVDKFPCTGKIYVYLGIDEQEKLQVRNKVVSMNGIFAETLSDDTKVAVMGSTNFTTDVDEYMRFLTRYMHKDRSKRLQVLDLHDFQMFSNNPDNYDFQNKPLSSLNFVCDGHQEIQKRVQELGGNPVSKITECCILLYHKNTSPLNSWIAQSLEIPVFDHSWLSYISNSSCPILPRFTRPPEFTSSFENCPVIITDDFESQTVSRGIIWKTNNEGGEILTAAPRTEPHRKFCAVIGDSVTASDRTVFCAIEILNNVHEVPCPLSHYPVKKHNSVDDQIFGNALIHTSCHITRQWLSAVLKNLGATPTCLGDTTEACPQDFSSAFTDETSDIGISDGLRTINPQMKLYSITKMMEYTLKTGEFKLIPFDQIQSVNCSASSTSQDLEEMDTVDASIVDADIEYLSGNVSLQSDHFEEHVEANPSEVDNTPPKSTDPLAITHNIKTFLAHEINYFNFTECAGHDIRLFHGCTGGTTICAYTFQTCFFYDGDSCVMTAALAKIADGDRSKARLEDEAKSILIDAVKKLIMKCGLAAVTEYVDGEDGHWSAIVKVNLPQPLVIAKLSNVECVGEGGKLAKFKLFRLFSSLIDIFTNKRLQPSLFYSPLFVYIGPKPTLSKYIREGMMVKDDAQIENHVPLITVRMIDRGLAFSYTAGTLPDSDPSQLERSIESIITAHDELVFAENSTHM